ncbi:hypothetical protein AB0J83_32240 [Actinoplanes sp. NPDC049596]|uniref:P-loop NTPase n=1 Tax=unclassified Actinoplanes TaxID=2626549 RepID=UPI00341DBA69
MEASGAGAVAIGGDNYGTITTGGGRRSIWLETDRFFAPQTGTGLYSHDWALVGRQRELGDLVEWLTTDERSVALLVGRGGIGKSRLLRAFAESATASHGFTVLFLDRTAAVQPEDIEVLPAAEPLLLILDDAHESPSVAAMVSAVRRDRPTARILLAIRPYGLPNLLNELRQAGVHRTELPQWELEDLTIPDATTLAAEVLGAEHDHEHTRGRLAVIGRDCPLVIVVGGGLVRQGALDPSRVATDETLRDEIMNAFATAIAAPGRRRDVLQVFAALQPFRVDEPEFQSAAEAVTGLPFDQVLNELRDLEDTGVVLRRGTALRIVPDLLGDTILAGAIADIRSGTRSGYLERVVGAVEGDPLLHLVLNASRVDWHVRHATSPPLPSLVNGVWAALVARFETAGPDFRARTLRRLREVVFHDPASLLRICQVAGPGAATLLPPVLAKVADNPDHLPAAVDLLWELARRLPRADRREPDHPVEVLRTIAAFRPGKSLVINERFVDTAARWTTTGPPVSPLEVLAPMLAAEGTDTEWNGLTLVVRTYRVDPAVVSPIRRRVIDLVMRGLASPERWQAARAAEALSEALNYPSGSTDQPDVWTPEFVRTLDRLRGLLEKHRVDPIVAVAIRQSVFWHARYAHGATRAAAKAALAALPGSLEDEVARALHDGWGRLLDDVDHRRAKRVWPRRLASLAERAVAAYPENELLSLLAAAVEAEQETGVAGRQAQPDNFTRALMRGRPTLARALLASVAGRPDSPLAVLAPATVPELLTSDPDAGWVAVDTLLSRDNLTLTRLTADGLGRWREGPVDPRELRTLTRLLSTPDETTRILALQGARRIAEHDRTAAAALVLSVPLDSSRTMAKEVLSAFGDDGYLSYDDVSGEELARIAGEVTDLAAIDSYEIQAFLAGLSAARPQETLELLRRRAERAAESRLTGYRAMPRTWYEKLRFRGSPGFEDILHATLGWVVEAGGLRHAYDRAEVFAAVAAGFGREVPDLLQRALDDDSAHRVRALSAVVAQAERTFVWDHAPIAVRLLRAAERHGEQCRQAAWGGLFESVREGVRGGTVGEPLPEDIEQRDRSRAVAATLPEGSVERSFYEALARQAEAEMRSEAADDSRFLELRDW